MVEPLEFTDISECFESESAFDIQEDIFSTPVDSERSSARHSSTQKRSPSFGGDDADRKKFKSRPTDVFEEAMTGSPNLSRVSQVSRKNNESDSEVWHEAVNSPSNKANNSASILSGISPTRSPVATPLVKSSPMKHRGIFQSTPVRSTPTTSQNAQTLRSVGSRYSVDDRYFEAIALYQGKIIELQKSQIEFMSELIEIITHGEELEEETQAKIQGFEFEIKNFQSCIEPLLKKHPVDNSILSQFNRYGSQQSNDPLRRSPDRVVGSQSSRGMPSSATTAHSPILEEAEDEGLDDGGYEAMAVSPLEDQSQALHISVEDSDLDAPPMPAATFSQIEGSKDLPLEFDSDDELYENSGDKVFAEASVHERGNIPFNGDLGGHVDEVSDGELEELQQRMYEEKSDVEVLDAPSLVPPQGDQLPEMPAPTKTFPWTAEVRKVLRQVFKLSEFRPNQEEAINSTLQGKDVFVLMPTGGGKSLCYQLPALINAGSHFGVTIVLSPLISLMQDQTYHLKKKGISAAMISAKLHRTERTEIFKQMQNKSIKLLYISPEMLNSSKQLRSNLQKLANAQGLARIVIDEAHCVSSWGHDFRPDYKLLEHMKNDFPGIPIMALTATANERVRLDIFKCLHQNNTVFLKQSFNRANLYYAVEEKGKNVNQDIANLMKTKFKNQSGIIYCHSRASCERTAQALYDDGLRVTFYHGSMTHEEREAVQSGWHSGRIHVICATIAFGMGIDKPDVRFVFHLTLPRNMEGYYQETGRAGRDGLPSECVLFYNYKDAMILQSMINRDDLAPHVQANQRDMLKRVIQYCENQTDCRRKQVLQYFGETFDVRQCMSSCDNCKHGQSTTREARDVTTTAREIVELVQSIQHDQVTLIHCIDVYRGSKNKKLLEKGHDRARHYNSGTSLPKGDTERIFHHLVTEGFLDEYSVYNGVGFSSSYIKGGAKSYMLLQGREKITMLFEVAKKATDAATQDFPVKQSSQAPKNKSPSKTKSTKSKQSGDTDKELTFQEQCYHVLEAKRQHIKGEFGSSRVTEICSNSVLKHMSAELPTDLESFSSLKGITQAQVENFYVYFRPELVRLKEASQQQHQANEGSGPIVIEDDEDEIVVISEDASTPNKNARKRKTGAKSNLSATPRSTKKPTNPKTPSSNVKMMPM